MPIPSRSPDSGRAASLLIADPSLRTAISFALEAQGVCVDVYPDMSRLLDDADESDCVIIDVAPNEPDPTSEQLDTLRRHPGRGPVIVLASCPSRRMHEVIAAAGAILVEKPLLTDALCSTIERLTEPSPAL